jgi:hypothetical protein
LRTEVTVVDLVFPEVLNPDEAFAGSGQQRK